MVESHNTPKNDVNKSTSSAHNHKHAETDELQSAKILTNMFREKQVYVGGSSMGKGFRKAASYYLNSLKSRQAPSHFQLEGAVDLNDNIKNNPVEESFYVVDLGVVVSQFYQWRKNFPRVECFYAVKCNPDPLIVKTLAILGSHFDCASSAEIRLVQEMSKDLARTPEILYANPCKGRSHMIEAVCRGVRMVTFDNMAEVSKCAAVSKSIQLVLRIVTDDRGSRCRFSSKFGAHRSKWRPLLAEAKRCGLEVVGVSFHVGSGCRDASKYGLALKDAKEIFEMAEKEFGFKMTIVDIGGGFPGETHAIWNPKTEFEPEKDDEDEDDEDEIYSDLKTDGGDEGHEANNSDMEHFMYFNEIAEAVAPMIDQYFPEESGVRLIAEPGRFFSAAAATLVCSVTSARFNVIDDSTQPIPVSDKEASKLVHEMEREEETTIIRQRALSFAVDDNGPSDLLESIKDELAEYSRLFASQQFAQQESDVYNDALDLAKEGFDTAVDVLGPPDDIQLEKQHHTVEGMTVGFVTDVLADDASAKDPTDTDLMMTLAAAGEAAVNGIVLQAVADSAPLQDDYAYYINDGVYGAFNNIMFDHAVVRPRQLKNPFVKGRKVRTNNQDGLLTLEKLERAESSDSEDDGDDQKDNTLYASTVFGPTCDSIDVIARSVLLPKMKVGDWMYFQNMGAYTMAAASTFNGFSYSDRFYVSSVKPEYLEKIFKGPPEVSDDAEEEKKEAN
jgi:ornithine decarboxylase